MGTRRYFAIFTLVVLLSLFLLLYVTLGNISNFAEYALTVDSSHKTILFWNGFFGHPDFYLGEGYLARDCLGASNCFATHSRFLQNIEAFDAIVFHGINKELDPTDLPAKRRPEQRYVFVALESPANRFIGDDFDGYFNLTLSYHLDSDIVWTASDLLDQEHPNLRAIPSKDYFAWKNDEPARPRSQEEDTRLLELIRGKRRLAVWYRSNCRTRGHRENYVAELERHLTVDKFGACSEEPGCPRDQDCFKTEIEPLYFFYLSFENSLCDDYVTEKLFNALRYNVVPVVYGGANYSRFAPPKSYVNALDFDTPKDLADYLIKLSHNVTEYKKYFDWKRRYRVISSEQRVICDLCKKLNSNESVKKQYDISKWYSMIRCPLQRRLDKQISFDSLDYATKKILNNEH